VLLLLATAGVALALWWIFGGTDEMRIRRRLDDMARVASRSSGEQPAVAFGKARELSQFFTATCEAADGATGAVVSGREEVARAIAWAREEEDAAEVVLEDVQVLMGEAPTATATLTVRIRLPDGSAGALDRTEASLTWAKQDGTWLIQKAFVERPGR
jgi:ketosteroid isomerase-like protein